MQKSSKGLIIILLIVILGLGSYIIYDKIVDKEDILDDNNIENEVKNNTQDEIDKQEVSKYPEWMQYILNSDIKSITIYKLMDETDKDYKVNQNCFYTVEISQKELEEIFDSMNNVNYKIVLGMGGVDDYIKIVYNSDNKDYEFTITSLGFIYNSDTDEQLNNLLRSEINDFINNMTDEEKQLYNENPVPNMITDWNNSIIYTYFDNHEVSTYYYEQ